VSTAIDPITVEIFNNNLLAVAEEMGVTLIQSAFSTNIKERKDCSTALFDRMGMMIAQAEHIPMHLGSLLGAVTAVLAEYRPDEMHPGDVFMTNDPYSGGGTHLPDITVVTPVFTEGRLMAFVANLAHHADVGGKVPGSTSGDATSIFQEGLRIPLVRLASAGVVNTDAVRFLTINSRTPEERRGDLYAQIAANTVGSRRLIEVIHKYGPAQFDVLCGMLLDYSERLMRAGLACIADGEYRFTDYMDDDGIDLDRPIPIGVVIRKAGSEIEFDFSDSSPQVSGPINVPFNGLLATVFYCLKVVVGGAIPSNHGIYRPVRVTAPERCIVNCVEPAPVGQRIDTCQRVADVIFGALSDAVPRRIVAGSNSSVTTATFSGINPATGAYFVYLETIGGGLGAHAEGDGMSGVQVHMTNTSNLPIEALETEYPLLVTRYAFRTDSGGAGAFMGGLGLVRTIQTLSGGIVFSGLADRQKFEPWGLKGGLPGLPGQYTLVGADGAEQRLTSKVSNVMLNKGDAVRVETPGGGGYGPPGERPLARLRADVTDGKITAEFAARAFGVDMVREAGSGGTRR
jgi:N-methylhydantoinase B